MAGHPPRTTDERLDDPRVARHAVTTSGRTTATMVTVDQELLKRVFENLVLNAAQAVTIPGTIAVDTSVTGAVTISISSSAAMTAGVAALGVQVTRSLLNSTT